MFFTSKVAPKWLPKWIKPLKPRTCLLLFVTCHAITIIDLPLLFIAKCFICPTIRNKSTNSLTYALISANFSFASGVLLTSGWNYFANLKYDLFISSYVELFSTVNTAKNTCLKRIEITVKIFFIRILSSEKCHMLCIQ